MEIIYYKVWDKKYKKMYTADIQAALVFPDEDIELIYGIELNGKKFFVGDILEINNPKCQVQKAILQGEIIFRFGSFGVEIKKVVQWEGYSQNIEYPEIVWFLNLINNKEFKVIGNKFENPELLK